ncbi:MAG TPA: hypothetical protein VFJ43_12030 [Bacteroidia bacterium]|nr:hypothetical protein [Bacteroidia bacterium]
MTYITPTISELMSSNVISSGAATVASGNKFGSILLILLGLFAVGVLIKVAASFVYKQINKTKTNESK